MNVEALDPALQHASVAVACDKYSLTFIILIINMSLNVFSKPREAQAPQIANRALDKAENSISLLRLKFKSL